MSKINKEKQEYEVTKVVKEFGNGGHTIHPEWLVGKKLRISIIKE